MKLRNYAFGLTMASVGLLAAACGDNVSTTTTGPEDSVAPVQRATPAVDSETAMQALLERYTSHDDGTVSDKTTGLTWLRCSMGQEWDGANCGGEAEKYPVHEARQLAQDHSYAGQSDWRLPTVEELASLVYCSSGQEQGGTEDGKQWGCAGDYQRPTIASQFFPATPEEWFWTSSNSPHDREYFWSVNFGDGAVLDNDKINRYHLRLVRTTSGL